MVITFPEWPVLGLSTDFLREIVESRVAAEVCTPTIGLLTYFFPPTKA